MNLKKALTVMKRYSGRKALPICDYLLLEKGKLTSTNLDMFVEYKVPFEGEGLIPVEQFKKIADKNSITDISFEDETVKITTDKGVFSLHSPLSELDFPIYDADFDVAFSFTIDKEIKGLKHFTGTDELNLKLAGLYFDDGNVVATDAHKLKWLNRDVKGNKIVSREIYNLPEGEYMVSFGKEYAKFEIDGMAFIFRLIDATFPNYKAAIPNEEENSIHFTASRRELIEQLENCLIAIEDGVNVVEISTAGTLRTKERNGNGTYEGKVSTSHNEAMKVCFSIDHLLQALKTASENKITFKLRDEVRAVLINDDTLIMPVKY